MGLDNGIMLRVRHTLKPDCELLQIPGVEKCTYMDEDEFGSQYFLYDICYWRKCWNIRDILFNVTEDAQDKEDNGRYTMTVNDLVEFRNSLVELIGEGPEAWNDSSQSIWEFEEILPNLAWDLVRLSALIRYLQREGGGNSEVYFYDSY